MQELVKFNLKINVIPNGLEKYMSFIINNKLSFTDSFQFLSSSLDSLVKNLSKDDFKYSNQRILSISNFEKFNEELYSKEKFHSLFINKKSSNKECEHVLNVWNKFEILTMKDYHDLHLKYDVLLLAYKFEEFRNISLKNYGLCPSHHLSAPR